MRKAYLQTYSGNSEPYYKRGNYINKVWRTILSYWRGNEELWKAFCIYLGTAFGTNRGAVWIVMTHINNLEALNAVYLRVLPLYLFYVFLIAISIWSWVSVWRCAPNTPNMIWCWVSRGVIIIYGIYSLSGYVGGLYIFYIRWLFRLLNIV